MIWNYLITTLRNAARNGTYTLINVLGLSIGITACIILYLLISYELGFDKFNSKYHRIYRVVQENKSESGVENGSTVPYPFIGAFRNDFTDIPLVTGFHYEDDILVKIGDAKESIEHIIVADSLFFDVFDYKVISGNPRKDLGEPGKVFLTESYAKKVMKGDRLTIKVENYLELEVAGIIADPPASSHIGFTMVISYPSLTNQFINGMDMKQWGMTVSGYTYFVLPDGMTVASVEARLENFLAKYEPLEVGKQKYLLQPLSDIHFSEKYTEAVGPQGTGNMNNLVTMGVLGIFILAIACVNFVNLATALAIKKSKEIGIRKTLGAGRSQLTTYFLAETLIIILISILISLCAAEWLIKWLSRFLEKSIHLDFITDPFLVLFIIALVVITTLLSGLYPAMILSGYNPVTVLKNRMSAQGSSGAGVRKVLVIFQFTIAQALIIGTLIIADQMNYFRSKPLGFNKDAIINVGLPKNDEQLMESFGTRLSGISGIETVSFSLGGPTSDNNFSTHSYLTEGGGDSKFSVTIKPVDFNYMKVYGLKLRSGRWFTEAEVRSASTGPGDKRSFVYVVNEAYSRKLGFDDPSQIVGKMITTGLNGINAEVIGVLADFHTESLHVEIPPTVMTNFPFFYYDAGIRITSNDLQGVVSQVRSAFDAVFPEYEFDYEFMDEHLATLYRQDDRTFTLFKIFSGVSIFIGCLGLYGLISFMANQKQKEVGIRKVMGATVGSIVFLFGKEFMKLIAIAFLIATPVTIYFMTNWLNGFAYRTSIDWTNFAIGIAATLAIVICTVSYRSMKSAIANPVDVLRSE